MIALIYFCFLRGFLWSNVTLNIKRAIFLSRHFFFFKRTLSFLQLHRKPEFECPRCMMIESIINTYCDLVWQLTKPGRYWPGFIRSIHRHIALPKSLRYLSPKTQPYEFYTQIIY